MATRTVDLLSLFTAKEFKLAISLKDNAKEIAEQVVLPAMEHINMITGQENDPMYFAYMLVWAIRTYPGLYETAVALEEVDDALKD